MLSQNERSITIFLDDDSSTPDMFHARKNVTQRLLC